MTVGTLKEAIDLNVSVSNGYRHDFAYLDEGCSRTVYRKGNVVYKVEHDNYYSWNRAEYRNRELLLDSLPANVRIPKMSLYMVENEDEISYILACEYISGYTAGECYCRRAETHDPNKCLPEDISESLHSLGLFDIGYGNVIFSEGVYWLVDLGEEIG